MIQWEETAAGVRAVDAVDNQVRVDATGWRRTGAQRDLPRPVDASVDGVASALTLPEGFVHVADLDADAAFAVAPGDADTVPEGHAVVGVTADVKVTVAFDGPARVEHDADAVHVTFPGERHVALGFRSLVKAPAETVTVPRTPVGVATAITHSAAAHRTTSPDRTYASMRRHPPQFAFGGETHVPSKVARETPDTGIELVVPQSLRTLFLTSTLAHYLGATVRVESGADPRLVAPGAGVDYALDAPVEAAPSLLERVFWLDCLARNGGPHGRPNLVESDLLTDVGLEHESVYEAAPDERLRRYLDAPFDAIADDLPEWPLAMHVAPEYDNVPSLPFLLNRLAFVYPPETASLEGQELMERSLDDFYRDAPGPVPTVEMLKPKLRRGRIHGWLAEGTPIDVFKTLPEAYENHVDYLAGDSGDELSVAVVLNDQSMAGEHEAVADIYESRAEDLPMDVSLREGLGRDELADLFLEHHEFVHYIGHCEVDGLRCPDGNLALGDLPETNVETFFLNACGSYYEGLDLVENGAVAGAVTFRKVLDEQAAKVGTAFARLLVHGFPIETAIRLARRRIMMGKDYAVVGDGMQTLSQTDSHNIHVVYVDSLPSGDYGVSWEQLTVESHGGFYELATDHAQGARLCGNPTEFTTTRDELAAFLDGEDLPVVLDGEFTWTDDVVETLRDESGASG